MLSAKSNGFGVCSITVPPIPPSSCSTEYDLLTSIRLKSSDAKSVKSKARVRLTLPRASMAEDVIAIASIPLTFTRVKSGPNPLKDICRPSPPSRVIVIPGIRCKASARFKSGKSAMSSDKIVSCVTIARRLISLARINDWRNPVTSISTVGWVRVTALFSVGVAPELPVLSLGGESHWRITRPFCTGSRQRENVRSKAVISCVLIVCRDGGVAVNPFSNAGSNATVSPASRLNSVTI